MEFEKVEFGKESMIQSLDFYGGSMPQKWPTPSESNRTKLMIPESRQEPTVLRVKDHTCPYPAATLRFLQFNIALLSPHLIFLSRVSH